MTPVLMKLFWMH